MATTEAKRKKKEKNQASRAREHVIETESRRIVAGHFPAEHFVERDQTERDYRIDMTVEHFNEGEPSGRILLLQLKGTDGDAPAADAKSIPWDAKVKHLLRCERFATPILLVWVPVNDEEKRAWFIWVQAYIRIVLDHETPDWRQQKSIRLHIPIDNQLGEPNIERKLVFIAGDPARAHAFGQLSRLAHNARWAMDDPVRLAPIFEEALTLDPIFCDPAWEWGQMQRRMIEQGLRACEIAFAGKDPTDEQLRELGWFGDKEPSSPDDPYERWRMLATAAQHNAQLMSTAVAMYYDNCVRHVAWEAVGDHDF